MRKLGYILISFALLTSTAYAEVTQFSFTTEPQTILPNIESATITVQSQDASGVSLPIDETFDLVFNSTSGTGVFLSTSGNPVSTTMSKNTSNKNFLYKDSTEGNFTLTVSATGRTSGKSFTASQAITISSGASTSTTTNTSTTTQTQSTNNSTGSTQTVTVYVYSAHSSPSPLSETENKISFEVSGGRDRLTSVGNELVFKANTTKVQNISMQAVTYKWSFGDGTTASGNTVSHSYKFPGDYIVVLNANGSDSEAVSRLNVKVISPNLIISKIDGGVEIQNNSKYEINLEGWNIADAANKFTIPKDTIVPAGKSIIVSDLDSGPKEDVVSLLNPFGKVIVETKKISGEVLGVSILKIDTSSFDEIQKKINEVKKEVSRISKEAGVQKVEIKPKFSEAIIAENLENSTSSTSTIIYIAPKNSGIISKIFSWPGVGWQFFKRVISD